MGSIVGGITDAIGLTDNKGEKKAARNAANASAAATAMSKEQIALMKEQLEFQKTQYGDWKALYGDIQENLGDYYKNLDPVDVTAMGLQNQQVEFQAAVKAMEREAAQRGLSGSGLEFAAKSNAIFQNAEARARIRTNTPKEVAEQKLSFLGVGLGQGTQMLGLINQAGANANNAFATGVNAQTTMAGNFLNRQTQVGLANMETMNNIFGTVTGYYMP